MIGQGELDQALRTALEAAQRGARGANPLVGACVLDGAGRVIATGFHLGAGNPHAEIDALRRLGRMDRSQAAELTMVVTLEPCNHRGRTGPCAQAIANAGIGQVHYAMSDETATASGGADYLRSRGVAVSQSEQHLVAWELNHRWFRAKAQGRPFITVKTAQSLDGRINAPDGSSQWITGDASRNHAHGLRSRVDAIVVGTNTVIADDPRLTARTAAGGLHEHQPYRFVLGHRALPEDLALAYDDRWEQLRTHEVHDLIHRATELGFNHLLIEGGAVIASAFIEADLADEIYCYQAPVIIGAGGTSVNIGSVTTLSQARQFRLDAHQPDALTRLGADVLMHLEPLPERTPHTL
ncbi:riboflavin biosynthesis protein RibD [Glutamicibacter sp. BW80]|uniref:bifunctional diaminohydroxyphosphoribosylaminopyrimidine deaminase/5-amino-6-(5-phosphoribosylamino)uracil reductase RibD n=1 Tax=Glutamicibacter sp. BW80 TaxID=2024404 RepID=UPI000BB735EA|nr:bifunctional diaminohydroxyphosphoribosylaminopyrimidine deaminase/5-amino-6-(5-phosphoribosylamino)uracil reductase RibD [Glutamicibacter sp. BW80]PCC29381.1 riboflavin biosynthesis protein RibD [Glutamicibacter sp. BW80]